ncbi:hypothetical protein ONZ45_g9637 [Pleurotus djamor]|nr:hypothetical protein ONZ45_g9637 [Pleurotus djamor]
MLASFLTLLAFSVVAFAASRTSPPSGAIVVRAGTTTSGEFSTINAALNSLPNDSSSRSIFIYPGTYSEQVYITRSGPLTIYGYTTDTNAYTANVVTITAGIPASQAGSNDASGSQAIAISNYGTRAGLYACGFYGFQDTLYSNQGTQVYLKGYIEGAVDFIFGRLGQAYFGGNTIAVSSKGYITASGREADNAAIYVLNANRIILSPNAASGTAGNVFLGRPWGAYAKVIFKNSIITLPLNPAIWSVWNSGDERTDHILFAEYNTTGSGVSGAKRPSFATMLSQSQANSYTVATAVGSDWASWVDSAYMV